MLEGLFTWNFIRRTPTEGEMRVKVNPRHRIFEGHFPKKTVLPGVCQMWLVRRAVSEMTGQTLRYGRVREVKFLHPILPQSDCELTVRVVLTPCEQGYSVQANISTDDEPKMKIKAQFQ